MKTLQNFAVVDILIPRLVKLHQDFLNACLYNRNIYKILNANISYKVKQNIEMILSYNRDFGSKTHEPRKYKQFSLKCHHAPGLIHY